jgi:hypothetical protein
MGDESEATYDGTIWVPAKHLPAAVTLLDNFPVWAKPFVLTVGSDVVADFLDRERVRNDPWTLNLAKAKVVDYEQTELSEEETAPPARVKSTKTDSKSKKRTRAGPAIVVADPSSHARANDVDPAIAANNKEQLAELAGLRLREELAGHRLQAEQLVAKEHRTELAGH